MYNAVTGTILFSTYQSMYHYLYKQHRVKDKARVQSRELYRNIAWTNLVSGAVAGSLHALVASPFEAARAHNAHSHKSFDYVNSARALMQHHGNASLVRGLGLVLPRDALGFGSFFAIYKVMKKEFNWLLPDEWGKVKGATGVLLAGGFGGMAYQLIAHPFEQIQHVYMTEYHHKFLFNSYRHTIRHIIETEGWNYFYRGVGARLKRAFSPAAIGFLIYEVTLKHRIPSSLD